MKKILIALLTLSLLLGFTIVNADTGPKESINITVTNANEEYILCILSTKKLPWALNNDEEIDYYLENNDINVDIDNFNDLELYADNNELWIIMINSNNDDKYSYSYNAPKEYQIIILSNDGLRTTEIYTRSSFDDYVFLDYQDMSITKDTSMNVVYGLVTLFCTVVITISIEYLVLCLFSLNRKENIKPFVKINMLTQLIMYFLIMASYIFGFTGISIGVWTIILIIPIEIIIFIIESLFYAKNFNSSNKKIVLYTAVANLASFFLGGAIYMYLLEFIH